MEQSQKTKVDCYVVFTKSTYKHWVMTFFNKQISHCYVMMKSTGGHFWHIINPTVSCLSVKTEFVEDYPHPRQYAGVNAVIVPVRAYVSNKPRWGLCFFTCVEVVKSVLGIKDFWIMTPWQLYKYLMKGNNDGRNDQKGHGKKGLLRQGQG